MKKKLIIILGITVIILIALCTRDKLDIVYDYRYSSPPFREYPPSDGMKTYYLGERYFVFNYYWNKKNFKAASIDLLCKKINDSTRLVVRYDVNFQAMGRFAKYNPTSTYSADFTEHIISYSWELSNPQVLKVWYKGKFSEVDLIFDCHSEVKELYNYYYEESKIYDGRIELPYELNPNW
jgi:hypothetical protein